VQARSRFAELVAAVGASAVGVIVGAHHGVPLTATESLARAVAGAPPRSGVAHVDGCVGVPCRLSGCRGDRRGRAASVRTRASAGLGRRTMSAQFAPVDGGSCGGSSSPPGAPSGSAVLVLVGAFSPRRPGRRALHDAATAASSSQLPGERARSPPPRRGTRRRAVER
jgi:hypothetical protein